MKKLKARLRERKYKKQMTGALILLWRIEISMQRDNWPVWKKKQFWRDFIKSPRSRERVFRDALKSLAEVKK